MPAGRSRGKARPALAPKPHAPSSVPADPKRPFDLDAMFARLRSAVRGLPDAAMFALRDRGHGSVFAQIAGCLVSIRTRDEVSLPAALRLLDAAPTPEAVRRLGVGGIEALIRPCTFHEAKARQIHAIAERAVREHGGALPCDGDLLRSLPGVGPKCANLALGIACGEARIAVDVHVHRVTNRWGLVAAPTPVRTMAALERVLPRRYWIEINRLLVPFGKHVCTGVRPRCSTCPVLEWCRQVGVTSHR